jgi:hypothetical protein
MEEVTAASLRSAYDAAYKHYLSNDNWRLSTGCERKMTKSTDISQRVHCITQLEVKTVCNALAALAVLSPVLHYGGDRLRNIENLLEVGEAHRRVSRNRRILQAFVDQAARIVDFVPPPRGNPGYDRGKRVSTDSLTEEQSYATTRFKRREIDSLVGSFKDALGLDIYDDYVLKTKRGNSFELAEGFILVCIYFATAPNLTNLQVQFQRGAPALCRILNDTIYFIDVNFGCLVDDSVPSINANITGGLGRWAPELETFVRGFRARATCALLPPIFGLFDGSINKICRPVNDQRPFYSGRSHMGHSLNAQTLTTANGLAIDVQIFPGSFSDAKMMVETSMHAKLRTLREHAHLPPEFANAVVYGDSAYKSSTNGDIIKWSPTAPEKVNMSEALKAEHTMMKSERQAVEHLFKESSVLWHIKDASWKMKVGSSVYGIDKVTRLWYLLTNYHIIFRSGQVANRYNVAPPSISNYNRGMVR